MVEEPGYSDPFKVSASGIFRAYIPSIENYEQAVGLYLSSLVIDRKDEDSAVQREGMLKGAIVFAMMAVEAQMAHVVREHVRGTTEDEKVHRLIERQISEPLSPRRMLSQWAYDLVGVKIDTRERRKEPLNTYFELVDYRNATVHSDRRKHDLIRKWTHPRRTLEALRTSRDMIRKLDELFDAREDYVVRWVERIYRKAEEAKG